MAEREETMATKMTKEEWLALKQKEGGVVPSKIGSQIIYFETVDYVYKLTQDFVAQKFRVESGHPALPTDGMVVGIKSVCPTLDGWEIDDFIGKDCLINLTTPYGYAIITRKVTGCSVQGENFNVELWT